MWSLQDQLGGRTTPGPGWFGDIFPHMGLTKYVAFPGYTQSSFPFPRLQPIYSRSRSFSTILVLNPRPPSSKANPSVCSATVPSVYVLAKVYMALESPLPVHWGRKLPWRIWAPPLIRTTARHTVSRKLIASRLWLLAHEKHGDEAEKASSKDDDCFLFLSRASSLFA